MFNRQLFNKKFEVYTRKNTFYDSRLLHYEERTNSYKPTRTWLTSSTSSTECSALIRLLQKVKEVGLTVGLLFINLRCERGCGMSLRVTVGRLSNSLVSHPNLLIRYASSEPTDEQGGFTRSIYSKPMVRQL